MLQLNANVFGTVTATFVHRAMLSPYQFFDQDGSGAIDTKELGNIMRQLGAKLTDAEINLLVQEADVDGDGQVDINEASKQPPCVFAPLVPQRSVVLLWKVASFSGGGPWCGKATCVDVLCRGDSQRWQEMAVKHTCG